MLPGWWVVLLVFGIWVAGIFVMIWLSYRYEWFEEDVTRPLFNFLWPLVVVMAAPVSLGRWIIGQAQTARKAAEEAKKHPPDDPPPEPRGIYR